MTSVRPEVPPPQIPGFAWERQLGAGGSAEVHLFRQATPSRQVAVKVLSRASDATGTAALAAEADALAAVAGHPAVVTLYATGLTTDGRPYLAMEYCPVTDLAAQVRRQPMAPSRVLEWMVHLSSAAETLHRCGLVHRDIKPGNVLISAWGRPVLSDFGSCRLAGSTGTQADGLSVPWAPPEQQLSGTLVHPTQDVWALAATSWTLLCGRSPFEDPAGSNSVAAMAARIRAGMLPPLAMSTVPPELEEVLRAGMRVAPGERIGSAVEFAEHLRSIQQQMRLAPTALSLESAPRAPGALADEERTRVRLIPSIDPGGAESVVAGSGNVSTDPNRTLPPSAVTDLRPDASAPRGPRTWVIVVLVVVTALLTAAVVANVLLGGATVLTPDRGSTAVAPVDPINRPPQAVSGLRSQLRGQQLYWSWSPVTEEGVHYLYTITRPNADPLTRETPLNAVDVRAVPGHNCIEVTTVNQQGRASDPVSACVDVG